MSGPPQSVGLGLVYVTLKLKGVGGALGGLHLFQVLMDAQEHRMHSSQTENASVPVQLPSFSHPRGRAIDFP